MSLPAAEFRRPGGQVVVASAGLAAAICTARVSLRPPLSANAVVNTRPVPKIVPLRIFIRQTKKPLALNE
jgi:hypothetical protein